MIVLLFEKRFWPAVSSGDKVHTIRRTRKRPIVPGDSLSLRGWDGKAYRSPQRVLCDETCLFVRPCWIDGLGVYVDGFDRFFWGEPEGDAFAKSDGFADSAEMREYWRDYITAETGFFSGDLIQWGVHPLLAELDASKLRST